jgi:hypothetical protein
MYLMYLRPASISVRSKGRLNTNTILWEYGLGGRVWGGNQDCTNGNKYCPSSNLPGDMPMMIHVHEQKRVGTKKIEENYTKWNTVRIVVFQGVEYED